MFGALRIVVTRLSFDMKQIVEITSLAAIRDFTARIQSTIASAIHIYFRRRAGSQGQLQQYDVNHLPTTHIQSFRTAANDLDIVDLVCGNAAELVLATVILAGNALTVDQYLAFARAEPAVIISATATAATTTAHRQANARNAIDHVIG
jgi:hypothetical protein